MARVFMTHSISYHEPVIDPSSETQGFRKVMWKGIEMKIPAVETIYVHPEPGVAVDLRDDVADAAVAAGHATYVDAEAEAAEIRTTARRNKRNSKPVATVTGEPADAALD